MYIGCSQSYAECRTNSPVVLAILLRNYGEKTPQVVRMQKELLIFQKANDQNIVEDLSIGSVQESTKHHTLAKHP
jgi:hypothetical protein